MRAPDNATVPGSDASLMSGAIEPSASPSCSASGTSRSVQHPEAERCQAALLAADEREQRGGSGPSVEVGGALGGPGAWTLPF